MKRYHFKFALFVLFGASHLYAAQPPQQQPAALQAKPNEGERLSALLSRQLWLHGVVAREYNLAGLAVVAPKSQDALEQAMARDRAIQALRNANPNATAGLNNALHLLGSMPVTGRLQLPSTDGHYLEANPKVDPILDGAYTAILPPKVASVWVLGDVGICKVPHVPGAMASDYLKVCFGKGNVLKRAVGSALPVDVAWAVSPAGRVSRLNVNTWNSEPQGSLAAGTMLWAPSRAVKGSEALHQQLAAFLATQPSQGVMVPARETEVFQIEKLAEGVNPDDDTPWYISSNDYGVVGLLQTPSARMRQQGSYSATFSRTSPYSRYSILLQPFDWMEAGFRYNNLTNRKFGVSTTNTDQGFKDKNFDVKFRLMEESAYLPQVAIGFQDVGGTGLFSGEYLVGSKRVGAVDFSLGLGWGYIGARGGVSNPFKVLGEGFERRPTGRVGGVRGGEIATGAFFKGQAAFFGGLQVQLPWDDWVLKVELDGNDYQSEPLGGQFEQRSDVNVGVVHRMNRYTELTLGYERGNEVMVSLSFHDRLDRLGNSKVSDPPRMPVTQTPRPEQGDWAGLVEAVKAQTGWHVLQVQADDTELKLQIDGANAGYWNTAVDRIVATMHHYAPQQYAWFSLEYFDKGQRLSQHVVDRNLWVRQQTSLQPNSWRDLPAVKQTLRNKFPYTTLMDNPGDAFSYRAGLGYQQILGGPDGFLLYQVSGIAAASYSITPNTVLNGRVRLALIDNFDRFKYTAPSRLPRVRTFQREYATTSDFTIPNLQLSHYGKLNENLFYAAYGGLLEDMFAGIGGEVLYRPVNSRVALGVDMNAVRQRDFEQDFGLRNYRVNTGHATLYWDTGIEDILLTTSVGQYLAGDRGATVDMSRVFDNGVKMGAFFTRTNVSAEEFGEGSFDKGVYVTIPFDAFFTKSVSGDANLVYRPLTRDGGAKLSRRVQLYGFTQTRDPRLLEFKSGFGK